MYRQPQERLPKKSLVGAAETSNPSLPKLRLSFQLAPGDTLVGTCALASLHQCYPNRFITDVTGTATDAIFANNPYVTKLSGKGVRSIKMEYPLIHQSDEPPFPHFMQGYVEYLKHYLDLPDLRLTVRHPQLYLTDDEKTNEYGKYWVLCQPGAKNDFTTKRYPYEYLCEVVETLAGRVQFIQVGQSNHNHKPIPGCIDLIGRTSTRELIRLVASAQGVLTGVSLCHHLAAAYALPCVTIASGCEAVTWEAYPTGKYLSAHSTLSCCRERACWATSVEPCEGKKVCELPVLDFADPVPRCMQMIEPGQVVKAIEDYYRFLLRRL